MPQQPRAKKPSKQPRDDYKWWQSALAGIFPPAGLSMPPEGAMGGIFPPAGVVAQTYPQEGKQFGFPEKAPQAPPTQPPTQLTPYAAQILERTGGVPAGATVAQPTPPGEPSLQERLAVQQAMSATQAEGAGIEGVGMGGAIPLPEGMPQQYTNAAGQTMFWDGSGSYIQMGFDPTGVYQPPEEPMSEWQREQLDLAMREGMTEEAGRRRKGRTEAEQWQQEFDLRMREGMAGEAAARRERATSRQRWEAEQAQEQEWRQWQQSFQQQQAGMEQQQFAQQQALERERMAGYPAPTGGAGAPQGQFGRQATWNPRTGAWDYPPLWGVDPATLESGYVSPWEREQFEAQQAWQQQQMAFQQQQQQAQQQQRLAQLRAQPASWLQYASEAGTTPAIQPWMMPLMQQQYPGLQAGGAMPGWNPQGESYGELPQLTTPSAQYMSRLAPSQRQQYGGYRQAQTGETPSDVKWRQWSQAPPSGQFGGLQRRR